MHNHTASAAPSDRMNLDLSNPSGRAHNLYGRLFHELELWDSWSRGNKVRRGLLNCAEKYILSGSVCFSRSFCAVLCSPASNFSLPETTVVTPASAERDLLLAPSLSFLVPNGQQNICVGPVPLFQPDCVHDTWSLWLGSPLLVQSAVSIQPRLACIEHLPFYNLTS